MRVKLLIHGACGLLATLLAIAFLGAGIYHGLNYEYTQATFCLVASLVLDRAGDFFAVSSGVTT